MSLEGREKLREYLAKDLEGGAIDDGLWQSMTELGLVDDALYRDGQAELIHQLQLIGNGRAHKPVGRALEGRPWTLPDSRVISLDEQEANRANVVGKAIAESAHSLPPIRAFRDEVLVNGPLSAAQAHDLVRSVAASTFTRTGLKESDVPISHESYLVESEERRNADGWYGRRCVAVRPPGAKLTVERELPLPTTQPHPCLAWPTGGGDAEHFSVWPGSLLHEVSVIAYALAQRYPFNPAQAAWFLLTNDPGADPVRVRIGRVGRPDQAMRGQIQLTVDPWVSALTVEKTYRFFQRAMLKSSDNKSGDNRRLEEKSLAVFRFVEERRSGGDSSTFRALARAWNDEAPEIWRYDGQLDRFKRTYDETRRLLLQPSLNFDSMDVPIDDGSGGQEWVNPLWVEFRDMSSLIMQLNRR